MNITILPTEILLIIIQQLDLVSLFNLYTACDRIRQIISQCAVIKTCNISTSTMSSTQTLKLDFFKDISRSVQELDVSGITDLNKKILTSAISRMSNLKKLNISYTNISILDFIEIYQGCPTITNISIDFSFNNKIKILKKSLLQCQEVFKNFESVNFIGSISNLLYSQLPFFILYKAKLKTLQYSIIGNEMTTYENEECEKIIEFDEFTLYFCNGINPKINYCCLLETFMFTMLDFQKYEIIITFKLHASRRTIYATPVIKQFFKDHFDLHAECLQDFDLTLSGNACVMLWSKSYTQFNQIFFEKLLQELKPQLPYFFKSKDSIPLNHDWYCTIPTQVTEIYTDKRHGFKRQRIVQPNYVLNYDEQFREKNKFQLSLLFNGDIKSGVTLSTSCNYLRKLTYLNLCGPVRYSGDFFNILFRCCSQLITFIIEVPPICSCFASIAKSIPLSQSLKNIRVLDRRIDFELMFSCMSQCKTLENVNISDMSSDTFNLTDPYIMFQNCNYLYCLYVYGSVTDTVRLKKLKLLKCAKTRCQKPYLKINVFSNKVSQYFDPYIGVFKLNPIKQI